MTAEAVRTVYGYLRLTNRTPRRRTTLTSELATYCEHHGLLLAAVFTDYGVARTAAPVAFVGLLDVLAVAGTCGVLVPSATHLGRGEVATARRRRIARTGARLLFVHPAFDSAPERRCA